ncbi:MAG: hypothetical protein JNL53_20165 [Cyclobacteriaceae bacterium]|nr:hypothetical protein [Cyclobacteriaceae bacterium]
MRRIIFLVVFIIPGMVMSQSMGPLSGSQPKSFSLLPDNAGFLDNSINLFTGQVQFSMPLMSIQGRGNAGFSLAASYSSIGVREQVNRWNRESPTGILGLGWSLETPRIVVDHKGTGTREDDDFYLQEGGSSNQLIFTGLIGSEWDYYAKNYQPWRIRYQPATEKWIITKEDGTQLIYGDNTNARSTIQYMVRWGNWIGNSSLATGQQAHAYIWNLSEVIDLWGDKITLEYLHDKEKVGTGTVDHTKAAYLKEIRNLNGERISLVYLNKLTGTTAEYLDMHQEAAEPDAYQEKFESKYLDKLIYYNETNELLSEVRFGYGSIGTLEFYKRQLTSITQFNNVGAALPGYQFQYETSTASTANTGALKKVISPLKGTVDYIYSLQNLPNTNRELAIDAVAGYAEPRIFIGEDYVVVTRRAYNGVTHDSNPKNVRVDVFTWDGGKWISNPGPVFLSSVNLLDNGDGSKRQDFNVALGRDFFGILNKVGTTTNYDLKLFRRDNSLQATWTTSSFQFVSEYSASNSYSDVQEPILISGEKFVFVGSKNTNQPFFAPVRNFVFRNTDSGWQITYGTNPKGEYYYSASNNYYISHLNASNQDIIYLSYLNKAALWQTQTFSSSISPNTTDGQKSYWHSTNSFSLLMGYGTPEYIYSWDENYNNAARYTASSFNDYAHVNFVNNSLAVVSDISGSHAYRFNGSTWLYSGLLDYYGPNIYARNLISLGEDFVLRPRNVSGTPRVTLTEFNPNTSTWINRIDNAATATDNLFALLGGYNYVTYSGKFFFRTPTGTWPQNATVIPYAWIKSGGGWNDTFLQGGYDFVTTGDPYATGSIGINFKNGIVNPIVTSYPGITVTGFGAQRVWDRANMLVASPQAAMNTLVTYFGPYSAPFNFMEDALSLKLYRKVQDSYYGSLSAFVATRMESFDGNSTRYVNYQYDANTATADNLGSVAQFNKVTVVPDTDFDPNTRPIGRSENFFFNGLPSASTSAGGAFIAGSEVLTNYKKITGAGYRSISYGASGSVVSTSETDYKFFTINAGWYVRPLYTIATQDGLTSKTSYTYDAQTGLPVLVKSEGNAGQSIVEVESTYWWQKYDVSKSRNLLSPVILQRKKVDGVYTESSATKWKSWGVNLVPAPFYSYQWKYTGASDFEGFWQTADPAPPAANWKLISIITKMDEARGLVREVYTPAANQAKIWHPTKPRILAEANYTVSDGLVYEGFEDCTVSCSTDAAAGGKSKYNTSLAYVMPASDTYKVTYWKKISGGSWTLIEDSFTGTNYSIPGTGVWIDEVRIHRPAATMTSYSYDKFGNVLTVNGPNNLMTYYEYDSFNRSKLIRDKDKNIVESSIYNTKN